MKAPALALGLALLVAACFPPAGTLFRTILPAHGEANPLPVVLGDQTGLVTGIEPAPSTVLTSGMLEVDPNEADANSFYVTWLGGLCDSDAALSFERQDAGYVVHLDDHQKFGSCPAVGIAQGILVRTTSSIDPNVIALYQGDTKAIKSPDEDCGVLQQAQTSDAKIACFALFDATIGGHEDAYASVSVAAEGQGCAAGKCATAADIETRWWRVDAVGRDGRSYAWQCAYHPETATCEPSASPAGS